MHERVSVRNRSPRNLLRFIRLIVCLATFENGTFQSLFAHSEILFRHVPALLSQFAQCILCGDRWIDTKDAQYLGVDLIA